ncbi:MAG: DUF4910 domain-containing protein [Anaerolineae bacterium]|jgi:hypothetical protein
MFKSLWETLSNEISGPAAAQAVADIARFHRIQASPGFRHAAEWTQERLARAGLETQILTFPADQETSFWSAVSFQEWEARQATLHLLEPVDQARKLADYRDSPLHLAARSLPFAGEAEVVLMERGENSNEYEGLDLTGKVVLTRGSLPRVHDLAVIRRGAVGLIYDGMREVEPVRPAWSLPDAIEYTSFWWRGQEPEGFGFALTPREGERLRRSAREHTLRVRAHVDARLYDGTLEVVEATIPGTTDEQILLVAHLCHPQPSANDNASGAAALLEVARALEALIAHGDLSQPRRTIRFLWVPEIVGTFAYLSTHEDQIPHMVAGLNLDMVGQDQEQCGSSLLIEQPPDALSNFAGALLARLRERLLPEVRTHGSLGGFPLFRYADTPFSGGSDHYIFSDPSVGVPMPMIIQWPDRFYHTSGDTPDRVDPRMLERVGSMAGVYAYWLAQAGQGEVRWLAREMSARFRRWIIGTAQEAVTQADEQDEGGKEALRRQLRYRSTRHREALDRLRRLAAVDVSSLQRKDTDFAEAEWGRVANLLPSRSISALPEVDGAEMIPEQRFRGPLQMRGAVARLDESGRDSWWELQQRLRKISRTLPVLAQYWANGDRSVAEIAALVQQEAGHEAVGMLTEYFQMLANVGLVEMTR